ncbi:hypothetical protein EVAR_40413_1 [Eumeta japonica]|uniref:Uncharacterized protein n=1 Tax=Eumeta variegata TaxID=151549 RepID=A0A4C1WBZ1_EUMVA|nr:hypothetical protein EVAR_40413_1 [Eumeta japonica]
MTKRFASRKGRQVPRFVACLGEAVTVPPDIGRCDGNIDFYIAETPHATAPPARVACGSRVTCSAVFTRIGGLRKGPTYCTYRLGAVSVSSSFRSNIIDSWLSGDGIKLGERRR